MTMPLEWFEITERLLLTLLAGGIIGFNRSDQGRPAGLRTTILVCIAASLSMILANLMLHVTGDVPDSAIRMDPMRLPLGVLTGMGFIGAGAILKRDNLVMGVTTAATLWLVTIIGLCIGSGFKILGMVAVALAMFVLWGLKQVEVRLPQDRRGILVLEVGPEGPADAEVHAKIQRDGFAVKSCSMRYDNNVRHRTFTCELLWRAVSDDSRQPPFLEEWSKQQGIARIEWMPVDVAGG
ncbi:MAG: MgtC/SapB family protein [Planctomycetaceae bacterium]